jgi:hypothetical protein
VFGNTKTSTPQLFRQKMEIDNELKRLAKIVESPSSLPDRRRDKLNYVLHVRSILVLRSRMGSNLRLRIRS